MDAETAKPRARAAWAYSGLTQTELAEKAQIHYDRLRLILGTSKRPADIPIEELWAIADAAGVPRDFMQYGFMADTARQAARMYDEAQSALERADAFLQELDQRRNDLNAREAELAKRLSGLPTPEQRKSAEARTEQALREEAQRSRERRTSAPGTRRASRDRPGGGA